MEKERVPRAGFEPPEGKSSLKRVDIFFDQHLRVALTTTARVSLFSVSSVRSSFTYVIIF